MRTFLLLFPSFHYPISTSFPRPPISRRVPHDPGPVQGFCLLKWRFSSMLLLIWGIICVSLRLLRTNLNATDAASINMHWSDPLSNVREHQNKYYKQNWWEKAALVVLNGASYIADNVSKDLRWTIIGIIARNHLPWWRRPQRQSPSPLSNLKRMRRLVWQSHQPRWDLLFWEEKKNP